MITQVAALLAVLVCIQYLRSVSISANTPPHRPSTVHDEDQTIPAKEDDLNKLYLKRLRNLEDALFYNWPLPHVVDPT